MSKIPNHSDVCIVGLGPAGLGAALTLSRANLDLNIICIDAGDSIEKRICLLMNHKNCDRREPCSMISGIGGSSFMGGNKYSMLPAGSSIIRLLDSESRAKEKMEDALNILSEYIQLESPDVVKEDLEAISKKFKEGGFEFRYYDAYSSSNRETKRGFKKIMKDITDTGISVHPNTLLAEIKEDDDGFQLTLNNQGNTIFLKTKYLILGIGRSGEDIINDMRIDGTIKGETNHLEVGVRLEFPTDIFPEINQFHNDLKLIYGNLRSFCVCKNGKIAPYYNKNIIFLDGFNDTETKTGFTNFAINLRLPSSDHNDKFVDATIKNVIEISEGIPIIQSLSDYLENIETTEIDSDEYTTLSYVVPGNINDIYPEEIARYLRNGVEVFMNKLFPMNSWNKIMVLAPVLEYSWPKVHLNTDFSVSEKLYLVGDCTGQFRGTLQAFCSGIVSGESIISKIRKEKNE